MHGVNSTFHHADAGQARRAETKGCASEIATQRIAGIVFIQGQRRSTPTCGACTRGNMEEEEEEEE